MKVRILEDFASSNDTAGPVEAGTVVEATIDPEFGDAWYLHPDTGEAWFSFPGDYEVIDE